MEPRFAESGVDQQVEFTCSIQTTSNRASAATLRQQQRRPDVVWKRNGKKLPAKWLTSDQDLNGQETVGSELRTRYVARHVTNSNSFSADVTIFTLTIMKTQLKDDNATFSCLVGASLIDGESANREELAHESNQIKLRVYSLQDQQQPSERERERERERIPITISANIAPPIKDVHETNEPTKLEDLPADQRKFFTTSVISNSNSNSNSDSTPPATVKMRTLKETLLDLYEISKPTLLGFAILFSISIIILLQWVYTKRKNRLENRYTKHHAYSNSSGSGGSGVSSAINAIDCADSNLENFMSRTISAQSAMSLCGNNGLNNGLGKKYRSYRDQLRKVAAVNDNSTDLVLGNDLVNVNGYLLAASQTQNNQINNINSHNNQTTNDNEPFFISSELPNLYNQSLAAREQARSLLQASEHMRSLGNLQVAGQKQQHKFHHQVASALQRFNGANQNGSHLNLPLSFVFKDDSETSQNGSTANNIRSNEQHHINNRPLEGPSQMIASALWQPQINQKQFRQQQQFNHSQMDSQQMIENYQLINCNSVSPCSTSSSSSCAKKSQGNIITTKQTIDPNQARLHKQGELNCAHVKESNTSLNHYSTIEMNDDDDSRYEEVEGCNQNLVPNKRSSVSLKPSQPRHQDSFRVSKSSNFVRDNSITENQSDQSDQKSLRSSLISNSNSNSSTSGCGNLNTTSSTTSNVTDVNLTNKFNLRKIERQQQNLETKKTTVNLQTDKTNRLKYKDQLSPYAVSSICSSFTANQPPPMNSEAMRALSEQFDINHLLLGESSDRNSSSPPFNLLPPPPPPPSSS